jgi:hypothetical protein
MKIDNMEMKISTMRIRIQMINLKISSYQSTQETLFSYLIFEASCKIMITLKFYLIRRPRTK